MKRSMRRRPIRELVHVADVKGFQALRGRYRFSVCGRRCLVSRITANVDEATCDACIRQLAAEAAAALRTLGPKKRPHVCPGCGWSDSIEYAVGSNEAHCWRCSERWEVA